MTVVPKIGFGQEARWSSGGGDGVSLDRALLGSEPAVEVPEACWLDGGAVWLRVEGLDPAGYPIVLLGSMGAWIEPDYRTSFPFGSVVGARLYFRGAEIGPLPALVVLQSMGLRGPLIGLSFQEPPARAIGQIRDVLRALVDAGTAKAAAASLFRPPTTDAGQVREIIDDPGRVRNILGFLLRRKGVVSRAAESAQPLCVMLGEVGAGTVTWFGIKGWSEDAAVEIAGQNSVFRFNVRADEVRPGELVSALPARVERLRKSLQQRGVAADLTARFLHPQWLHIPPIEAEVVDVSFSGLRLSLAGGHPPLLPRLKLSLELPDGDDGVVHLRGEVRSVAAAEGADAQLCSLHVTAARRQDERHWLRLVSRILHATTYGGTAWQAELWDLFDSSGYFNLSGRRLEHFDAIKPSFLTMAQKAAVVPHLLYNVACLSEHGIEGNFSIMKPYHSTWMIHQLAKRPKTASKLSSRQVLRDMFTRCFEHAVADPECRWIIAYAEAHVAWNERSLFEFARAHRERGLVLSLPFRLVGVDAPDAPHAPREPQTPDGQIEIGEPTPAEQAALLGHLCATSPRMYTEALDLVPGRLAMGPCVERWRSAGLARERALLVARQHGEPLAVAILELGELGTNLFRLLDSVRLFPMRPGGDAAFGPLLDAACAWFRRNDRASFIYFGERGKLTYDGPAGLHDLGEGRLWIIARELVPEFVEHVYKLTEPKLPQR
ncbi:PilZ domain-containing protein [Sorangium sp. So ce1000]|uniref:PilZ domain-containing protein n=1 Tax=Sorangium sp. So ce1000 TaxID=3133325 RepID=UPI003F623FD5